MALSLCILVCVGGRRSQRPGPSPTLGSLGPSHQQRHKSRVSLRGPPCTHGVSGTPYGEVRDILEQSYAPDMPTGHGKTCICCGASAIPTVATVQKQLADASYAPVTQYSLK